MALRALAAALLLCMTLFAAGCGGDDDEDQPPESASNPPGIRALGEVEPRVAKPNLRGGDAPIEDLAATAAEDAVVYWKRAFDMRRVPYRVPTVRVMSQPANNGCGGQFDPAQQPVYLCVNTSAGSTILLGTTRLDEIRSSNGDGAVAFLAGFPPALDATTQLQGGDIGDRHYRYAACFEGTWIRDLADRQILEAGDDLEVLDAAAKTIPGDDPQLGRQLVAIGFTHGLKGCAERAG